MFQPGEIEVSDVYHLPVIKAFADRVDLVNIINCLVLSKMETISPAKCKSCSCAGSKSGKPSPGALTRP